MSNFTVVNHGVKSIKTIRPTFPFSTLHDFKKTLLIDDIFKRQAINTVEELSFFAEEFPADGDEFVEWMHYATAGNSVLNGICADFADIGALAGFNATDPRQPGCGTPNIKMQRAYRSGGVAIASGQSFNIPPRAPTEIIGKDVLGWAAILWAGRIQWVVALIEWLKLGLARFQGKNIRFSSFQGQPMSMPFKVSSRTPIKSPVTTIVISTVTDRPTTYMLEARNISDFRQSLFKDEVEIPAGENDILYIVNGFPFVDDFLLTIKPKTPVNGSIIRMDSIP